jgi:putative transposase
LVSVTKYRKRIFDAEAIERLKVIFKRVCIDFEAEFVERNGGGDQVHLLVNYPSKRSISSLVNSLKGVSSRLRRLERPDLERKDSNDVLWSPSYFAARCGGAPIRFWKESIERQKTLLPETVPYLPALQAEVLRHHG